MTIRYERSGLKVVRVPSPEATPAQLVEAIAADLSEADALIHTCAANLRALARMARRRDRHALPQGDHDGRRALAKERGVTPAVLAQARDRERLSQRDLGRLLGYSRGLVAECEKGRRNPPPRLTEWAAGVLASPTARTNGGQA